MFAPVLTLLALAVATPQTFDPAREQPPLDPPNQVLVLGTPHLSGIPADHYPDTLEPLLAKLAAYRPQIITIEALSGAQCAYLRTYPARWKSTVADYCWDPAPARAATGLDVPEAVVESERLLAALGPNPAPAARRRLAATFLAAGERASALVQWLRLPAGERIAADGLDAALVEVLEKVRVRHNEDYAIAAPLAARLGLDRLHYVDDHTSDFVIADEAAFGTAIQAQWDNEASRQRKAADAKLMAGMKSPGGLLAAYRGYNDPRTFSLIYRSDFGAALRDPSPQRFGRQYVGSWEVRNLRMVAKIRETLVTAPGSRVLTIVGASHKPYFDAYLRQMHDVRLVDAETVLK
ncbi:hypothetical protein FPZ54_04045 [Sphingomonas suaedae]|uniref:Uncharacterized protein n=1 Tax=Sphingomonas suaedae TaxID=2599297 RepID=A0A518RCW0_9SPHN|nr:DUF5694 domain-containing protein [Sphingomonas suaedae]QDX25280.1 hypothetical protein FPZ54_04045 [Sphingomonas suaedae]